MIAHPTLLDEIIAPTDTDFDLRFCVILMTEFALSAIGTGGSYCSCAPATPPGIRVRTGRFKKLRL